MSQLCRCHHPDAVDLTASTAKQALIANFSRTGWSPIWISVPTLLETLDANDKDARQLVGQHRNWKELCIELFEAPYCCYRGKDTSRADSQARFIQDESGSVEHTEPKQSWEWHRRHQPHSHKNMVDVRLHSWTTILTSVAQTVCRILDWPTNVLLVQDKKAANLDLLRAFYYEKENYDNHGQLGSSPHTDWGSFTVVWQDQVEGCLQMHCPVHDAWRSVSVATASSSSSSRETTGRIPFIIHTGDIIALCLRGDWPSPLHRVVSPVTCRRNSLVCFTYPPPTLSLSAVTKQMADWRNRHVSGKDDTVDSSQEHTIYDDNFLLHNQSHINQNGDALVSAAQQFVRIQNEPLGTVLENKWRQVER